MLFLWTTVYLVVLLSECLLFVLQHGSEWPLLDQWLVWYLDSLLWREIVSFLSDFSTLHRTVTIIWRDSKREWLVSIELHSVCSVQCLITQNFPKYLRTVYLLNFIHVLQREWVVFLIGIYSNIHLLIN